MLERLLALPPALRVLFVGTIVTRLGSFVFPYLTLYLAEERAFGTAAAGAVLSIGSVGLLCGNLAGGVLADLVSRKHALLLALLLNAAGFTALAWNYAAIWPYALWLFLAYFGSGMYTPAANTLIADLSSEAERPFAYTVHYVCVNVGMAGGPLLGGLLAASGFHWLFIGDVISSLACAGLILFAVPQLRARLEPAVPTARPVAGPRQSASKRTRPLAQLVSIWARQPFVFLFCAANFFLIAPLMGLEYAVPLLVSREFGAELIHVGIIYSINAASILVLSFFIERLVATRNAFWMMTLASGFWCAGLAILFSGYNVGALMLCTLVWTVGEIIASILVPSFVSRHVEEAVKGRFLSLIDAARSLASVLAPITLGLLWQTHGARFVILVLLGLPVVAALAYPLLASLSRGRFASPSSSCRIPSEVANG